MYLYTEKGRYKAEKFLSELKAKRKEILDAGIDSADDTPIPTIADFLSEIDDFVDEDGDYYNGWGVTDNYDTDYPLFLKKGVDFAEADLNDTVTLIDAPNYLKQDIGKTGRIMAIQIDSQGNQIVSLRLEGDDGDSLCFASQLLRK